MEETGVRPLEPAIMTDDEQESAHAEHIARWTDSAPEAAKPKPGESGLTLFIVLVVFALLAWMGWGLLSAYWVEILQVLRRWTA